MQKVVFNGHYLMYVDTAVSDYWRAMVLPYEAALRHLGGDIFVKKATVEYHASARFDDVLDIGVRCARVGNSSMVFEAVVYRGDTLIVSCELLYVYTGVTSPTPRPVPAALRAAFDAYEGGQVMAQLQVGDWSLVQAPTSALRTEVFVQEQGIGAHMVWDDADAHAVHALVCNHLGLPVASGRMVQHAPGVARIGRMAVSQPLRGSHLGRQVLFALIEAARQRGDTQVMLHAQLSAQGFYTRLGFVTRGSVFEEAGIQHIEMHLPLVSKTQ
jgi:YbgC/YbaW family acyl-CoA thioester hydrolase